MVDDMGNLDMSWNGIKYDMFILDSFVNEGVYFDWFYSYFGCMFIRVVLMIGCYFLWMGLW